MDDSQAQAGDPALEREWLQMTDVEAFVASAKPGLPVNIVGHGAAELRVRLAQRAPGVTVQAISFHDAEGVAPTDGPGLLHVEREKFSAALLPRSRTIILDPAIGQWLLSRPDLLKQIALKTFEWLILPIFVSPEQFRVLFSNEFSFEEPVYDDSATRRWCWSVSDKPATVFVHTGRELADRRVSFEVTCTRPGTFVCRLGNQLQAFTATESTPSHRFTFVGEGMSDLTAITVAFTGEPLRPDSGLDQRKALYFSYTSTQVEGLDLDGTDTVLPPNGLVPVADRMVRRILHGSNFFEVQSLATPWKGLAGLVGLRSCHDYQAGFAFRDVDPSAGKLLKAPSLRRYDVPAMWYQARRTPTPGSEWTSPTERLRLVARAREVTDRPKGYVEGT